MMRLLAPLLLLLQLLLCAAGGAGGQRSATRLAPGSRLRLSIVDTVAATGELRFSYPAGTYVGLDQDAVVLRPDTGRGAPQFGADTLRVPLAKISFAESFAGLGHHALHGALGGLGAGAVVGYVFAHGATGGGRVCQVIGDAPFCGTSPRRGGNQLKRTVTGGAAGAAIGAVVGYFIRTERWTFFDAPTLRAQLAPELR